MIDMFSPRNLVVDSAVMLPGDEHESYRTFHMVFPERFLIRMGEVFDGVSAGDN